MTVSKAYVFVKNRKFKLNHRTFNNDSEQVLLSEKF